MTITVENHMIRRDANTLSTPKTPEEFAAVLIDLAWKKHGGHYNPEGCALIGAARLLAGEA